MNNIVKYFLFCNNDNRIPSGKLSNKIYIQSNNLNKNICAAFYHIKDDLHTMNICSHKRLLNLDGYNREYIFPNKGIKSIQKYFGEHQTKSKLYNRICKIYATSVCCFFIAIFLKFKYISFSLFSLSIFAKFIAKKLYFHPLMNQKVPIEYNIRLLKDQYDGEYLFEINTNAEPTKVLKHIYDTYDKIFYVRQNSTMIVPTYKNIGNTFDFFPEKIGNIMYEIWEHNDENFLVFCKSNYEDFFKNEDKSNKPIVLYSSHFDVNYMYLKILCFKVANMYSEMRAEKYTVCIHQVVDKTFDLVELISGMSDYQVLMIVSPEKFDDSVSLKYFEETMFLYNYMRKKVVIFLTGEKGYLKNNCHFFDLTNYQ